ncbi:MAG TPA: alpha/beta hydrolase [Bacteroidetes bacterium]|nr:alpha/beta hydrolase [Bacteroidota bacterium]
MDKLIHKASGYQAEGIMEAQKAMMKRPDRTAVLENAKIPVLFIFGEHDTFITPEKAMQQVKLPRVSFAHLLPNVGHMGMFEATHKTQFLVKQFVEYCESENEKT